MLGNKLYMLDDNIYVGYQLAYMLGIYVEYMCWVLYSYMLGVGYMCWGALSICVG